MICLKTTRFARSPPYSFNIRYHGEPAGLAPLTARFLVCHRSLKSCGDFAIGDLRKEDLLCCTYELSIISRFAIMLSTCPKAVQNRSNSDQIEIPWTISRLQGVNNCQRVGQTTQLQAVCNATKPDEVARACDEWVKTYAADMAKAG